MDLSKAFDTINHELLIAKLHAYGVDRAFLEIMHSLTNRWQRTKINETFSTWSELITGVPQGSVLCDSSNVKLLGVNIDNHLKFDKHLSGVFTKASQKLHILTRLANFLTFEQKRLIFKSFFEPQFKYWSLVWMFHSRFLNSKTNRLHKRALRLVYNDFASTFDELLEKDGSFTVHHSNIQVLAIELHKIIHGTSTSGLGDLLSKNNNTQLRSRNEFSIPLTRSNMENVLFDILLH